MQVRWNSIREKGMNEKRKVDTLVMYAMLEVVGIFVPLSWLKWEGRQSTKRKWRATYVSFYPQGTRRKKGLHDSDGSDVYDACNYSSIMKAKGGSSGYEADRPTSCLYIFSFKMFLEAERPLFELVHDDALVGRKHTQQDTRKAQGTRPFARFQCARLTVNCMIWEDRPSS